MGYSRLGGYGKVEDNKRRTRESLSLVEITWSEWGRSSRNVNKKGEGPPKGEIGRRVHQGS